MNQEIYMNDYAMSRWHGRVPSYLWLSRAITIFIALWVLQQSAHAAPLAAAQDRIVALAFDHASGTLFKATTTALSRSNGDGRAWSPITLPPTVEKRRITAVTVSARAPHSIYVAITSLGILHSQDGGQSWKSANKGLAGRKVAALSAHADEADTVYAYVDGKGIFRSQDAGATWRLMDRGPREPITRFVHSNMPGSMQTGWLFAATSKGVRRSMDCFCGWHKAGEISGNFRAVSYDPDHPERVYAATREGLFVSANGGEQWAAMKSPASGITALVATPAGGLYLAADSKLFHSRNGGVTWENADA